MNAYIHVSFVVANEKSKKLQQFIILTKVLLSLFLVNQIRYCNTKERSWLKREKNKPIVYLHAYHIHSLEYNLQ